MVEQLYKCRTCPGSFPEDGFYTYKRRGELKRRKMCKTCDMAVTNKWRLANRLKINAQHREATARNRKYKKIEHRQRMLDRARENVISARTMLWGSQQAKP